MQFQVLQLFLPAASMLSAAIARMTIKLFPKADRAKADWEAWIKLIQLDWNICLE